MFVVTHAKSIDSSTAKWRTLALMAQMLQEH